MVRGPNIGPAAALYLFAVFRPSGDITFQRPPGSLDVSCNCKPGPSPPPLCRLVQRVRAAMEEAATSGAAAAAFVGERRVAGPLEEDPTYK
jgi:hypothetical protein